MKAKLLTTAVILILTLLYNPAYSCTTFCIHTDDELVFGKNYDWMIGYGIIFVNKKDVVKTAFTDQVNPASWVSKYGSVSFNQFGREFPMGGMNEAGLVIELMWLDATKFPEPDDRPTTGGILQWIQYQLDNSETIQDVIDSDLKIRIPTQSVPVHYLIADKTGNCASIEFLNGKLIYHTGETMMLKTLTNDTYEKSIEYLGKHKGFGGTQEIKDDRSSLDRFVKSCSMIKNYKKEPGVTAVDYGFEILKSVDQGQHTKWNIVYDIKNMIIYFRTYDNQKIKNIYFSSVDFNCATPVMMIDINSDIEGNVNSSMINYTYDANRKLIEQSYNGVDFLKNEPQENRDKSAKYPEKLNCRSKSSIDNNDTKTKNDFINTTVFILTGIVLSSVFLVVGYKIKKKK